MRIPLTVCAALGTVFPCRADSAALQRGMTMGNTKHTPGPWVAEITSPDVAARVLAPNGCGEGCPCEVAAPVMPEDARLIAAAPELAEALRALDIAASVGAQALRASGLNTAASLIEQASGKARTALAKAGIL